MSNLTAIRALSLSLGFLAACGGETTIGSETSQDSLLLEVDHFEGVCDGLASWYCPRVRAADGAEDWRNLPCEIDDFDPEWGYRYLVEVVPFPIEETVDGCGTVGHRLLDVLTTSPVAPHTQFSRDVLRHELLVDQETGTIRFVNSALRCDDPSVCDALARDVGDDGASHRGFNLVFEHRDPGDEPVLVAFDTR
ncbi:MAG: hypothetical protein AAF928_04140 [Myxococcota bacterium]